MAVDESSEPQLLAVPVLRVSAGALAAGGHGVQLQLAVESKVRDYVAAIVQV